MTIVDLNKLTLDNDSSGVSNNDTSESLSGARRADEGSSAPLVTDRGLDFLDIEGPREVLLAEQTPRSGITEGTFSSLDYASARSGGVGFSSGTEPIGKELEATVVGDCNMLCGGLISGGAPLRFCTNWRSSCNTRTHVSKRI